MWDPQVGPLAERFTVIRYDVRGFGQSRLGPGRYSDEGDLAALLDALGHSAVHLLGSSMGGRIALDFALRYPDAVRSLVIVPGGISGWQAPEWMNVGWERYQRAVSAGDLAAAREAILDFPPMRPLKARPDVRAAVAGMIDAHRWSDSTEGVEYEELEPPAAERLGEVDVPVLLVSGANDDPAFLASGDQMGQAISKAQRLILADASHMVNMERPEAFNRAVLSFIRRVPA